MEGSFLHVTSPLVLSVATLIIAVFFNLVRHLNARKWPVINKESVLRLLGIRLGDIPTTVILDSAVAVDALVRHADAFSDRPAGGGATTIISNGRLQIITTVPYGPHWVALRRNLTSEAFHPVRGLARAAPHRARALAALVADIAARSGGGGAVPVRECLYAALFALNAATCFGDGVDGERVEAMRAAQQEFLRILPSFRVFATFQKVARLLYRDRWNQLVHSRRRQEEMYLPLIRACQERRSTRGTTTTTTSYVDTLLNLVVPDEGNPHGGRRKLTDGEMVGLVSEYLGAATGTVLALLEWTLANLVLRKDIQSRLRGEVEAAGGEACAYLRAVVMESLRRHPPVPSVQRHMSRDVVVGSTPVPRGTLVNFSLEEIGRDGKIWTSPEEFIPGRFMPGGEGEGVRLTIGSKEATKVMMMPFGAGRRICPGMGYAVLHIEYFLANLITAFEWHPIEGEAVDLNADHGFFTTMLNPLRARVVPRVRLA
ncbi:Cytochrome P450 89A9 [Dichanthelium oligosanthes]|uniref:Cytochrome P450 89A9 n=1 Tax=Dichanthelium oligosanthes TaxID=888268 RepID=A0A1E5WBD7_9POAL|nr:Cytochrome P450 89A9 [Dichanthelium oligosanthes]